MSSSDSTTKRCTECGHKYPATTEYFGVHKQGKYGLRSICLLCKSIHDKQYHLEHREEKCAKNAEYQRLHPEKGRERTKRYRQNHPERIKEQNKISNQRRTNQRKEWRENNPDRVKQYARSYRLANTEVCLDRNRSWYWSNPERSRNRVKIYRENNPEKVKEWNSSRRAREKIATGNHTAEEIKQLFVTQEGKCWYCGNKLGDTYHEDHFIPLSRGGSNDIKNIRLACAVCNLSKNNKLPWEWNGQLI